MRKAAERILVILNPASGVVSKEIATSIIFKKLRQHFETVSLVNTLSPAHAQEVTRQAMTHFDVFTAFGGDGTINSIASVLLNTGKTLAILPGGSGNGLARNLGIPLSWRRALDILSQGRDVVIDTGKINRHHFFNVAGVGLDGLISKKFNLQANIRGIVPYIYYALIGYFEMPLFRVQVTLEDTQFDEEIIIMAFANFKQYGAKAIIAPQASPYDKQLDLCILQRFKLLKTSLSLQRLFTGNIDKFPYYRSFKFEKIHIKSLHGPIPSHFDGEYGEEVDEYDVEVLPASIKVRIPPFNG